MGYDPDGLYDRSAAIAYAKKWWGRRNLQYVYDLKAADCANFVSQCLYAGGIQMSDWYFNSVCISGNWIKIKASKSWGSAPDLYNKLKSEASVVDHRILSSTKDLDEAIKSGNYSEGSVAFTLKSDGSAGHAMLVGKSTKDNIFYFAHTFSRNGYDTSTAYGLRQIIESGTKVAIFNISIVGWVVFAFFKPNPGKTDNAIITLGESQKFSEEEVQAAANCVLKEFKGFKGCDLKKLWYDEKCSNKFIDGGGYAHTENVGKENIIVLFSDFHTDSTYREAGFTSNSDYDNWSWALIRDSKSDAWRVGDFGY
jgi:hypothetical protein